MARVALTLFGPVGEGQGLAVQEGPPAGLPTRVPTAALSWAPQASLSNTRPAFVWLMRAVSQSAGRSGQDDT
ncbi:hypothetical protein SAMN05216252_11192 [Actinacidiphila glaucinigra]|uniref:Uncharacterized protein n=1 Tax=Actinacidiphila glaucinigra TaxID=235986 RepID=A0A239IRU0_9ACTN|nr:hypothetical protein SAMN05216252_11192 [Actinacidiphila glaucinigra]